MISLSSCASASGIWTTQQPSGVALDVVPALLASLGLVVTTAPGVLVVVIIVELIPALVFESVSTLAVTSSLTLVFVSVFFSAFLRHLPRQA